MYKEKVKCKGEFETIIIYLSTFLVIDHPLYQIHITSNNLYHTN